jgi:putative protease
LKIEGRGRAADYVSVVTKCYRQAVDAINDGQYNSEKIAQWQGEMSKVYNRGFWKGYYLGQQLGEWVNQPGSAATEKKIYIGKGNCYYPKIGVGEFVLEAGSIAIGDTLMVIGRSEGVHKERLTELRINGVGSLNAKKGDVVSLPWTGKVSKNDKLYKILDEKSA